MPRTRLLPDRVVLAAALVLTAVLFVPDASDPVNVVKLVALLICALLAVCLATARVIRERVARVPVGAGAVAGLVLLAMFLVATAVAPHISTAVYGTTGRNSGLLAYGAALMLFFVALRALGGTGGRAVLFGLILAGSFTALYGLLQYVGVDAIGWANPFNPVIAALGNPDFASAYLGIALPAAAWGALWTGWSGVLRAASGLAGLLMAGVALVSSAVQGPLAAAAGLAVLFLAWCLNQRPRVRQLGLASLGVTAVGGITLLALGLRGLGPAASFFGGISYRARTWYWTAAVHMLQRSPIWGVGLDTYGDRWRQERPLAVVRALGGDHYSDAAHSVPLQMLAQGGLLLGAAYLGLITVVAVTLLRALRRSEGEHRLLLGGLGGSWAAYQVQSAVSIDQVPLLTAHFVLAGAVLAAAGTSLREIRLPGALPVAPVAATARRRAPAPIPRQRQQTGLDIALLGVLVVGGLVLSWQALAPLRASRVAFAGDVAAAHGNGDAAVAAYQHAHDLAPYVAQYVSKQGDLYNRAGLEPQALGAYRAAARVDPFDLGALRTAGRLAENAGDVQLADRMFQRAARLDPDNAATLLDLTRFLLRHGGARQARQVLEAAVRRLPPSADLLATLGDARLVTGDAQGAEQAYREALRLDPKNATAISGLAKLRAR